MPQKRAQASGLRQVGQPEKAGDGAVWPAVATAISRNVRVDPLGGYPHIPGDSEKGECLPEDGIVAPQQVLGADDQHPAPVEVPVEVA